MIYRYLTPASVIVTEGNHVIDNDIKVRITDVAIVQLLEFSGSFSVKKIGGIDRSFLAPEIILSTNKQASFEPITAKADVWSVGAILYVLITGGLKDLVDPAT